MKQYPEFREQMAKLSQHLHLASDCLGEFNKRGLLELAVVEQTMATGVDADGRAPKTKKLMDELIDVMVGLKSDAAVRLIMIYIISQQGIKEDDRKNLFTAAGLSESEKRSILNLEKIGVTLSAATAPSRTFSSLFRSPKLTASSIGKNDAAAVYAMSRYVCNLKGVLEELTKDKLSIEEYPSILPLPAGGVGGSGGGGAARSVRRDKANSKWGNSGGDKSAADTDALPTKFTGGRNIVFMVGGACWSELRSCEEVMKSSGKEIICGSTCFLKPEEFLESVTSLSA